MTEGIINYSINEQYIPQQHQNQNNNNTNEQVEWILKFLSESPEAASSVHNYLQKNYFSKYQFKEPNSSTPKRSHPLDESGGSTNNGNSRRQHQRKRFQQSQENEIELNDPQSTTQNKRQGVDSSTAAQQVTTEKINNRKRISFAQLKHAVSSNLPCFHVQWAPDADREKIPSAICASELISKELKINGVEINGFTLVGWAGRKLKLGVNNKVDYATLVATDKWLTKINGVDIEVIKPKYTPDAFVLVIRYVPQELDEEFVANEIQRTIASANRISRIQYNYKRKTNDYRFEVKDYQEYQSILKLGRIAIGYSWLSVTSFYPDNRLTYCTKCWCIGHLRNHCNSSAKCRICLEMLTENSSHICNKESKCAQCNGKHHSLDNQCQVIRDYKLQLKVDVEEAINSGKLHRILPKEKAPTFELREQDFPALATNTVSQPPKWNIVQGLMPRLPNTTIAPETEMSVGSINNNLLKLLDSNKRIEEKVDQFKIDLKVVTLDTQLHQAVLLDVIETMKDFTQKFIPSSLTYNKNDRASLIPIVQQFYNRFCYAAMSLNDGFHLNRKVSHAPSQILSNNIIQPTAIMPTTENL